jgi:hypothetical protein
MKILKYTPVIKQQIGSKAEPAPYLHIAIVKTYTSKVVYAIYIWDTREIVEIKEVARKYEGILGANATDNREPLKGSGQLVDEINSKM